MLVTVVAPGGGRTSTRVPADVAAAELAPGLGAAVNVANVSELTLAGGSLIPPGSTLGAAGVTDGSAIHVVAPGCDAPSVAGPDRPGRAGPGRSRLQLRRLRHRGVIPSH